MRQVNAILNQEVPYENLDGFSSLGQIRAERVIDKEGLESHPKKWIKDCWTDYHGNRVPAGFKSKWSFAQKVFDLCKIKSVSPAIFVPALPREPRKGMVAYLRGARRWLERKEGEESFEQWLERIKQ